MAKLKSFSPDHLKEDAERSGLFQCPKCGLIWFGRPDIQSCPDHIRVKPVHVALLCRTCDSAVSIGGLARHLSSEIHKMGISN